MEEYHPTARGRSIVEVGACWRVGDGQSLNFWFDWWVGQQPIGLETDIDIPEELASMKVNDVILADKSWDIPNLCNILPKRKVDEIRAIPIPQDTITNDALFWMDAPTGKFFVSLSYNLIAGDGEEGEDSAWIWFINCAEKK